METSLVADRSCGPCTVCCTLPTIDEPELQKAPGVTCPNCITGQGCSVYETRPPVCRTWFCGWRQFKFIHSALRPDTAGVLVRVGTEDVPPTYATNVTLEFAVMRRSALKSPGLAETIAAAVNANIATFLVAVPDQPGLSSTRLLLNDALAAPVRIRDKGAGLRILDAMLTRGRKAEHRRVVLKHHATPTPP